MMFSGSVFLEPEDVASCYCQQGYKLSHSYIHHDKTNYINRNESVKGLDFFFVLYMLRAFFRCKQTLRIMWGCLRSHKSAVRSTLPYHHSFRGMTMFLMNS